MLVHPPGEPLRQQCTAVDTSVTELDSGALSRADTDLCDPAMGVLQILGTV
jgi:hypothetical protein